MFKTGLDKPTPSAESSWNRDAHSKGNAGDSDRVHNGFRNLFLPPYCEWSGKQILQHFQRRRSVQYFPVPDKEETVRSKIDNIVNNHFEFNQTTYHLPPPLPWMSNPHHDREWLIFLHKFYYAVGLGMAYEETKDTAYCQKWVELTNSWIGQVPLDFLPSDVAGRRIQNWIFAHYFFVTPQAPTQLSPEFYSNFLNSLSQQVNFLCHHLSPARNHRTLELCSIFLAGVVFPELRQASHWVELAKTELAKNIQTDLLADGVHCELSTDYHHLVLKNYLWIRKLSLINHVIFPAVFDECLKKALEFSLYVHKPDGTIPSLSDGDSGCFLDLLAQGYHLYGKQELRFVALKGKGGTVPSERSKGFSDSGYYILRSGWGQGKTRFDDERYLIFDCGPLGAGNHGHFDLLSFEMAAYGQSLIVDPGRYTYDESGDTNWRVQFRETAAHNTVLVDGTNQTRYQFDKTRYKIKGPQPDYELRRFETQPDFDFLHGVARSHEYPVVHERMIFFVCPDYWIVTDRLTAQEPHAYDLLFHLSPMAHRQVVLDHQKSAWFIHSPHLLMIHLGDTTADSLLEEGFVSQTYGVKEPAPIIRFSRNAAQVTFHTILIPYETTPPYVSPTLRPVYHTSGQSSNPIRSEISLDFAQGHNRWQDVYQLNYEPGLSKISDEARVLFTRRNQEGEGLRTHML